jgi:hypothetical protein
MRQAGKNQLAGRVGEGMQKSALIGTTVAALFLGSAKALAGPWEDGMVAL